MLCCYGLRGWTGTVTGRGVLQFGSRPKMILIKTFSPSTGRSLSKRAQVESFAVSGALVQLCAIEWFHESGSAVRSLDGNCWLPCHGQQMTGARRCGRCFLPMAACEADRSHRSDLCFFRYFILANRQRASDDWTGARVTRVSRKVKVLFSHRGFLKREGYSAHATVFSLRFLSTIARVCGTSEARAM
jgi:hypothetical protein